MPAGVCGERGSSLAEKRVWLETAASTAGSTGRTVRRGAGQAGQAVGVRGRKFGPFPGQGMCASEAALWARKMGGVEHSFWCRNPCKAASHPARALASCALPRTVHSQGHCAAFQLRQLFGQQAAWQQQQAGAALVQVHSGAGLQGGTRSQKENTDTLSPL